MVSSEWSHLAGTPAVRYKRLLARDTVLLSHGHRCVVTTKQGLCELIKCLNVLNPVLTL